MQLFLDSLFFGLLTFSKGEMNQKQQKLNRKISESKNSWHVKIGGVSVEGMMMLGKIGALVWDWKK